MTLHPMLREVLSGLDEFEQDTVERLCDGEWDLVTMDRDRRLWIKGRRTIFVVDDPEADEGYFDDVESSPNGYGEYYVPAPWPSLESVISVAATQAESPTPPTALPGVGNLDYPLCPCGCGQDVVNKPVGRQRVWATEACRRRGNHRKAGRGVATPVLDPTHGQIDPDIQQTVEAMEPVDLGQRVALENTLQARRAPHCVRCDNEGHFVEDCPQPMTRRKAPVADLPVVTSQTPVEAPVEDASQRSVREAKERLATQKANRKMSGEAREVITCGRCLEKGHSIFTCTKGQDAKTINVLAPVPATVSDDVLTAHGQSLLALCKDGLPQNLGYSVKEDVLALYGLDQDLLDSALRSPERVEIRPEGHDKEKRYCILGFYRGDIEVILGMRNPATPAVIAAYAHARLEHDTHRVGHAGAGGAGGRQAKGLPKNSKQVVTRLRAMGGRELEVELSMTEDFVPVTYKGQDLGKISANGDRATCEQDYQRIQRKMAAIDRRATG